MTSRLRSRPPQAILTPALLPQPLRKQRIVVGEVAASSSPSLLQTLLGSCVAVCLHDPVAGVGGMNHFLLPGIGDGEIQPARYGVHAMELLINAVIDLGGDRRRLVAKVFGAGNVIASLQSPTIGELNTTFIREFLATERIPLVAQRLGGDQAVQVHFRTDTGKATVHSVNGSRLSTILNDEQVYLGKVVKAASGGEVTLF